MENLLYISAAVAALAFLVLVIYLATVLVSTKRTLDNVAITLESLEVQTRGITRETEALLAKTNQLADDVNNKTSKLNPLFEGIKGIGQTVQGFNASFKTVSDTIAETATENKDQTAQAVKWGAAILNLRKQKQKQ